MRKRARSPDQRLTRAARHGTIPPLDACECCTVLDSSTTTPRQMLEERHKPSERPGLSAKPWRGPFVLPAWKESLIICRMYLSSGNATEPHHEHDLSDTVVLRGGFSGDEDWKDDTKDSRCTLAVFLFFPFMTLARTARGVLSRLNSARLQCVCCLLIQVFVHSSSLPRAGSRPAGRNASLRRKQRCISTAILG